ncbi:beta-lactamase family protein [Dictyostelium discoideum AX4]|uniref:ribonuclease Z n=1 Tax=Dictyostelium discoideum TaxID=44689 RepID=B0G112_DICDI|nr:beta-lactamase family protein [Dictyostelium discoideum AX4]EDR41096.1 beta-lactamase family protein [Dictyostelium discoideum AX4]|eukprot:XP_001732975.1 beta-lactamase family protein [Dictyostelium discoideum AX4]
MGGNYALGVSFVETIFNGSNLSCTYVFSEIGDRYLIDPSESTLRSLLGKDGLSFNKTRKILLTSLDWKDIGGIFGIGLSFTTFPTNTQIYGPPGIKKLFKISRCFQYIKNLEIIEFSDSENYMIEDGVFKVIAIPFLTPEHRKRQQLQKQLQQSHKPQRQHQKRKQQQQQQQQQEEESSIVSEPTDEKICYIFHSKKMMGRFDSNKARDLKITKQSKIQQLVAQRKPVMNEDRENPRMVYPEELLTKPSPGTSFAYINCPSEEYFQDLFNNPAWDSIKDGTKPLTAIYHKTAPHIMENPKYLEFIESISHVSTKNNYTKFYGKLKDINDEEKSITEEDGSVMYGSTKHILLHKEFTEIQDVLKLCDLFRSRLKILIPSLSIHKTDSPKWEPTSINSLENIKKSTIFNSIIPARNSFRVIMTPTQFRGAPILAQDIISHQDELQLQHDDYFLKGEGEKQTKTMLDLDRHLESLVKNKPASKYPKTLFLGTASSVPSEHRNVTGILISSSENNHFILDCGESTLIQMERYFGRVDLQKILIDTKMIWISHLHADHHLGLISIVKARDEALSKLSEEERSKHSPMLVVSHSSYINWITQYRESFDPSLSFVTQSIGSGGQNMVQVCETLGISSFTNVPVIHAPNAYGCVIDFNDGFRLTFSGDTRPCQLLEKAGADSDLLIHESTFANDEKDQAYLKRHSTLDETLNVSYNMRARKTIVTHFSQRYQNTIRCGFGKVPYGVAYDLIRFSPYQADLLYNVKDILDGYYQELNISRLKEREIIVNYLPKSKFKSPFSQDNIRSVINEYKIAKAAISQKDNDINLISENESKVSLFDDTTKPLKSINGSSFTTSTTSFNNILTKSKKLNFSSSKTAFLQNITLKSILMLKK